MGSWHKYECKKCGHRWECWELGISMWQCKMCESIDLIDHGEVDKQEEKTEWLEEIEE